MERIHVSEFIQVKDMTPMEAAGFKAYCEYQWMTQEEWEVAYDNYKE